MTPSERRYRHRRRIGNISVLRISKSPKTGGTLYADPGHGAASGSHRDVRKGDPSGHVSGQRHHHGDQNAHLRPSDDIDHVNAHGSSLPDYDICDSNAQAALGPHALPDTGHLNQVHDCQPVSAAGALQTVAASLSIQRQMAPPTINQEVPDPQCDLDYVPNVSSVAQDQTRAHNGHGFWRHRPP